MKKSEVNNKHKNKYGKLKTILSFFFQGQEIPRLKIIEKNPDSVHMLEFNNGELTTGDLCSIGKLN